MGLWHLCGDIYVRLSHLSMFCELVLLLEGKLLGIVVFDVIKVNDCHHDDQVVNSWMNVWRPAFGHCSRVAASADTVNFHACMPRIR